MINKQQLVEKHGIKALKTIIFVIAIFIIQITANAQTPEEQSCFNALRDNLPVREGRLDARVICKGTTNASMTVACYNEDVQIAGATTTRIANKCKPKPVTQPITTVNIPQPMLVKAADMQFWDKKQIQITALHSNKCVDVSGVSKDNGSAIHQWKCLQTDNQKWEFIPKKSGNVLAYQIKALHSGKCLDVNGGGTASGTGIIQWDCHGGDNQLWTVGELGGGLQIKSVASKKCLDVDGVSTADGAKMQIWDCLGTGQKNQLFKISDVVSAGEKTPVAFTIDPKAAYVIIEGTKGERLAAGSDDRVLRWGLTSGDEQRWQFVPSENFPGRYNLKSLKFDNRDKNKVLDIQWVTGSASIYPANKKGEQTFTVDKLTNEEAARLAPNLYKDYNDLSVDFVRIREWSRDGRELLTVGGNGAVYRWGPLNDNSQVFILRKEVVGADAVRLSFDPMPYVEDNTRTDGNIWRWNQQLPYVVTVYNPLDGGLLLSYKVTKQPGNADGCSGGSYEYKIKFRQACLGHDTTGSAPFDTAGFPSTADGISTGKDLTDYLFLKDMLTEAKNEAPGRRNIVETAAYFSYRIVQDRNDFLGARAGMEFVDKGGVIAIKNNGWFTVGIRVKWTGPQGTERIEEVYNGGGRPAVIPLSKGAKNIEVVCWAVGGMELFKETFTTEGMHTYTVRGNLPFNTTYVKGLHAN